MITIRHGGERGYADRGWLRSWHTFSFADYHDPAHMRFRALRVINEDIIRPGKGFGTHPHRDMEILTYMLSGALAHKDSMGNGRIVKTGELQAMSAGTGITHSEYNASEEEPAHLLQIWILPDEKSVTPRYGEWTPPPSLSRSGWTLLAARDCRDGSVFLHSGVELYLAKPARGESLSLLLRPGHYGWLQVARGKIALNSETLAAGDAAAFTDGDISAVTAEEDAELLLFDLP